MPNRGHFTVRGLPHRDYQRAVQGITFRLGDALPKSVLEKWNQELADLPADDQKDQLSKRIARYEDAGYGCCLLAENRFAEIVQAEIQAGHPKNYRLFAWVFVCCYSRLAVRVRASKSGMFTSAARPWALLTM